MLDTMAAIAATATATSASTATVATSAGAPSLVSMLQSSQVHSQSQSPPSTAGQAAMPNVASHMTAAATRSIATTLTAATPVMSLESSLLSDTGNDLNSRRPAVITPLSVVLSATLLNSSYTQIPIIRPSPTMFIQPPAKRARKIRITSVNRDIVKLNNDSIVCLQMGNPTEAIKLLTEASALLNVLFVQQRGSGDITHESYKYNWVDFSAAIINRRATSQTKYRANEGCIPYLFLRALRIAKACEADGDANDGNAGGSNTKRVCRCAHHDANVCPCGIAWVVWYNLAISCHILGCRLGERGRQYLDRAYHLYEVVRRRILSQTPSKDWSTLLMAVYNNQGCIYHECAMYDESNTCLAKLETVLSNMPAHRDGADWQVFCLNLALLQKPKLACAA